MTLPVQSAFLGARLQRLANLISEQGNQFFANAGSVTPIHCVSTLLFLNSDGPASLMEIARAFDDQHQLTAHRIKQLEKLSLIIRKDDPNDKRRRTFHLTEKGKVEAKIIEKKCEQASLVFERLNEELGVNLTNALDLAYDALSEKSIEGRVNQEMKS